MSVEEIFQINILIIICFHQDIFSQTVYPRADCKEQLTVFKLLSSEIINNHLNDIMQELLKLQQYIFIYRRSFIHKIIHNMNGGVSFTCIITTDRHRTQRDI